MKQIEYLQKKKINFFMTWKVPQTDNSSIPGWKADIHSLTESTSAQPSTNVVARA